MKRLLINLARILLTAGFLFLALRMVRFGDSWYVRTVDGRDAVATAVDGSKAVLESGEGVLVIESKTVRREGFTSILKRVDKLRMAGLAALLIVPVVIMSARWRLLMRANGFEVSFGRVFLVNYAGSFFNTFLPGGVGGDIAKAVMTASGEERKAAAVATVLLDRIIGLVAMILMAAVAVIPFIGDPAMRNPVIIIAVLFGGLVLGYPIYFSRGLRESRLGQWMKQRLPFVRTLAAIDGVMHTMKHSGRTIVLALLLSLATQAWTIVVVWLMAREMAMSPAPTLAQFFLFEPIIFIVTAVPLSIGGWGVQEGAYRLLLGLAGVAPNEAIALSLIFKVGLLTVSIPGGILFALGAAKRRPVAAPPS